MYKKGFIAYLESKNLSPITVNKYAVYTEQFLRWEKKEEIQISKADVLKYLEYLKNTRLLGNKTRSLHLLSVKHYFDFLLGEEEIITNPCLFLKIRGTKRKKLYKIYTSEELDTLFDSYYQLFVRGYDYSRILGNRREQAILCRERNALMLSFLMYQKVTLGEMEKIEPDDIDLFKATLKISGCKRSKDRNLPLKASQTGLLMNYLQNIRPRISEYRTADSDKLFFTLSKKSGDTLQDIFSFIAEQLKTIDKQFVNFKQFRASTVSYWIKTSGLRKAQYLAGHRYVSSTENYLSNNMDELKDDINKLHPF